MPDIRIMITTTEGVVIDVVTCSTEDLITEVKARPSGLLGDINIPLVREQV